MLLQQSEPVDEHGVSLVLGPGEETAYEAVVGAALDATGLTLLLNDEAALELGLPPRLEIALDLPADQRELLRRGLARLGLLAT